VEAAVAEGATLLIHRNSARYVRSVMSGPRTLSNDALSKVSNPKVRVRGLSDNETLKGTNGKVVEVHAFPNEHSDSLVMVYLPAEKILWTADVFLAGTAFNQNVYALTKSMLATSDRLNLQWTASIPAHNLTPERMVPKAEVVASANSGPAN
jgi:flavorubredoxin